MLYFRVRVPEELQVCLGCREYRRSLGTARVRDARPKSMRLAVAAHDIFQLARGHMTRSKAPRKASAHIESLTNEGIRQLARQWLMEALNEEYEARITRSRAYSPEELGSHTEALSHQYTDTMEAIEHADHRSVMAEVDACLKSQGIDAQAIPDKQRFLPYRKLCDAFLQAKAAFLEVGQGAIFDGTIRPNPECKVSMAARFLDEEGQERAVTPIHPSPLPAIVAPAPVPAPTLSEAVEKYITFKTPTWSKSSQEGIPPQLRQFAAVVQELAGREIRVSELTRELVSKYSLTMAKLPMYPQKKEYQSKGYLELADLGLSPDQCLSGKTLDTRFTMVRSFINWAELEDGYSIHAKKLNKSFIMPKGKATRSNRRAFTVEELRVLFHGPAYVGHDCKASWQFWVPIIALFTGMRVEEICQLRVDDIREVEGVWCFDINSRGEKTVKSEAGERLVPVHIFLLDKLGFLGFVAEMRDRQSYAPEHKQRLFPNLLPTTKRGNVGDAVTKWFLRYRRECGVGENQGRTSDVVFHSFRHTVINQLLAHKRADLRLVQKVVGHEAGSALGETKTYEGAYPIATLRDEVIAQLDFHETIGLEHLAKSKWIAQGGVESKMMS